MKDFIYNQKQIPRKQWRYGFRSSAATGCGWIATYNALLLMGYQAKPEKLIRYYQRQLPLINGNVGTFLFGPAIYFKQRGFQIKLSVKRRQFDEAVQNADVGIVFYYWRNKWKFGSHFVTVKYRDGQFLGYNTFNNSSGPDKYGTSLEGFLRRQKYFGVVLLTIRDKQKKKR